MNLQITHSRIMIILRMESRSNNKVKFNMDAFNSGLTYTYKDDSNLFFNVSRSFRFPAVDEFTYFDQNFHTAT